MPALLLLALCAAATTTAAAAHQCVDVTHATGVLRRTTGTDDDNRVVVGPWGGYCDHHHGTQHGHCSPQHPAAGMDPSRGRSTPVVRFELAANHTLHDAVREACAYDDDDDCPVQLARARDAYVFAEFTVYTARDTRLAYDLDDDDGTPRHWTLPGLRGQCPHVTVARTAHVALDADSRVLLTVRFRRQAGTAGTPVVFLEPRMARNHSEPYVGAEATPAAELARRCQSTEFYGRVHVCVSDGDAPTHTWPAPTTPPPPAYHNPASSSSPVIRPFAVLAVVAVAAALCVL